MKVRAHLHLPAITFNSTTSYSNLMNLARITSWPWRRNTCCLKLFFYKLYIFSKLKWLNEGSMVIYLQWFSRYGIYYCECHSTSCVNQARPPGLKFRDTKWAFASFLGGMVPLVRGHWTIRARLPEMAARHQCASKTSCKFVRPWRR